jgi:hypothetical protein
MSKVRITNIWKESVPVEPIADSRTRCYIITINVGDFIDLDESKVSGQIKHLEKKKRITIEPLDFKVKIIEKEDNLEGIVPLPGLVATIIDAEDLINDELEEELERLELEESLEKEKLHNK